MMNRIGLIAVALMLATSALAADTESNLEGTWSGDWMIKGGVPDAVTVQLSVSDSGKLTAKFLSPAPMECTTASYAAKTRQLVLEAADDKSGTHYKLAGKVSGTEIIGTIDSGAKTGTIRLVKWTYFPRPFGS
jgi:hypothetical protein